MKHLLIFITLITAYGCSPIPQLVAPSPVSATAVLKGRVDGVRAALDEARVLHLTNSPRARAALSSVLNSLSIIREDVMTFKQRLAV